MSFNNLTPPHTRTYSNDLTNREGSENLHYSNNLSFKYKLLPIVVAILGASAQAQTIIDNPKTELPSGSNSVQGIYIDKYQSGQGIKINDNILYVQPENWTSGSEKVVTDAAIINISGNAQPITLTNPSTKSASLIFQGFHLANDESSGLITLGTLGEAPTKGGLNINQGDLTITDSSSVTNVISLQGAGLNRLNPVGAELSAKNIYLSNLEAKGSLIFLQGSESFTENGETISKSTQSSKLTVSNAQQHEAEILVENTIANSAMNAHTGVSVNIDRIHLNQNTFRDSGISIGIDENTKVGTSYLNNFEVWDSITIKNTTVDGVGETGNFEAFALRKTNANFLEDDTFEGTTLTIDGIDVAADRNRVSGVYFANNTIKESWGTGDYPAIFMTVKGIDVAEGVEVNEIEGIHIEGNAPAEERTQVVVTGNVSDITAENTDIVGIKLKDNYDSAENTSRSGTHFIELTVNNIQNKDGTITAISVDQTNRHDESTALWDVQVSNLTSNNDTIGLDINNATVSVGDINVTANYALKANGSEIVLGEKQGTPDVNSQHHEYLPTIIQLNGRVQLSDTKLTFDAPVKQASINGTLNLENGSLVEIYQKLFIVSDLSAQGSIEGFKDALVIGDNKSGEESIFSFTQYSGNQRALFLSNQGYDDTTYKGFYTSTPTEGENVEQAALRVIANGKADFTNAFDIEIYGTIVAGRGTQEVSDSSGVIDMTRGRYNKGNRNITIRGDIYAGNGGQIDMVLEGSESLIEGQIDDYWELDSVKQGEVFRNTAFKDSTGQLINVSESGHVNLTLTDGAQWIARGQSFLTTLAFEGEGSFVDLTRNSNSSIVVKNLEGDGTFRMKLDKPIVNTSTGEVHSDMLYIQNMDDDAHYVIEIDPSVNVNELNGLRFATTNTTSGLNNFTLAVTDRGIFNRSLTINTEDYSATDEDNKYFNGGDGNGEGSYKPGDEIVTGMFDEKDATNWYIGDPEAFNPDQGSTDNPDIGGDSSLSDAGNALLATARGSYWTSVEIDRLTNRMGDARYANNGEDGLWIRLRQSRLGTDTGEGDFKSDNTVYQVGYDHAFQHDGGRQLVGIAFDYMDTDLDYKGISGEGNTDRYGITAYTTWLADNGFYVDVVGKWGRLDNDFDIINGSGGRVKADYDNNMWAISAEVGRKLSNPKTGMFIEPNAQLQYTMVTDAQYSTNQGTRVDQDRIDSVIGRMGVRIGRAFGEEQNHNIYAKADMFREFMGEQKIHVKDVTTRVKGDTITVQNKGFWFDVGGGFQSQLGRDAYAYADVEYRFGNDLDKSWIVNAGMRYEF